MRLLVCGDRHWEDVATMRRALEALLPFTVIEGEAPGADRMARVEAERLGITVRRYPAYWQRYGRAAGPIRNEQMLTEGRPTHVLAFHHNLAESRGTADMVRRARAAGIPVCIIRGPEDPIQWSKR